MDELTPEPIPGIECEVGADERGAPVLSVSGELDMSTVDRFAQAVEPIMAKRPRRLVVDVAGVRFADSSAIAKLVQWSTQIDDMEVRGASPLLRRVIESMGLAGRLRLT